MSTPIHVLLLIEDSSKEAALISRELGRSGLDATLERVESGEALKRALSRRRWDIVLADHELPGLDCLRALEIVRACDPEVSCVVVSGSIGEEFAVRAMRAGAQDYVTKDRLARLGPVVRRELAETEVRRERAQAIAALCASEARKATMETRQRLLAEAGATLVKSPDVQAMLQGIAELVVRHVAECCRIDLLDPRGELQNRALAQRPSWGEDDASPVIPKAALLSAVLERKPELRAVASPRGMASCMVVPLVARGRSLGVVALTLGPGSRIYGPEDLDLAEELSARCATAVDNAALFEQVRESVRVRDEFVAIAAHELRTPLTPLRMRAEDLAMKLESGRSEDLDPPRLATAVTQILGSCDRLAGLVERLLELSELTIGGPRLDLEEQDLVTLAFEVAGELGRDLERLGSRVEWHVPQPVIEGLWDRRRLKLALRNLLSNAAKFAPGEPIEVSARAQGPHVRLAVRDHGPGLSAEARAQLFERYRRAAPVQNYGGFGLGLWIVRRVAEEHSGSVEVWSEPGQGAEFTLVLPRRTPSSGGRSARVGGRMNDEENG